LSRALVTGASSGVGRAIALRLAEAGHDVVALGRNRQALDDLAGTARIAPLALELTDRAAVQAAVAALEVDILVNNAGIMPPLGPFQEVALDDIDAALAINVTAQLALTRMLVPGMTARRRGHIVFTGSTAGHAPFANMALYCATKAAVGAFAQALRLDLAPAGVRVTEIVAGRVETDLYRGILPEEQRQAMYADGAAVQPADVAAMVQAVLELPAGVDVARFDIVPTRQGVATGKVEAKR